MIFGHSLSAASLIVKRQFSSSSVLPQGLRIAFFGSDEFSIESLKKLTELQKKKPDLIEKIDVIARPPKKTGRGNKIIKDVPIVAVAEQKGLQLIRAETSLEINDLIQKQYEVAIAVSYGVKIPAKFLTSVKYSMNVHPSLLPHHRGASPLQFSWMNEDEHSGVTVQTLHPTIFDGGEIIAQTGKIPIHDCKDVDALREKLSVYGGQLLADVIESGAYVDTRIKSPYEPKDAPKLTADFKLARWETPASKLARMCIVMRSLFTYLQIDVIKKRERIHEWRRVNLNDVCVLPDIEGYKPGQFKLVDDMVVIQTGKCALGAKTLTFEYEKKEDAITFMQKLEKRAGNVEHVFGDVKDS